MNNLDSIAEEARQELAARDEAREKMLPLCRDSIRHSSNAIRAIHRHEFELAEEQLEAARKLLADAGKAVEKYSEMVGTGVVRDAGKELTEASVTLALVIGRELPSPDSLGVETAAYLNGIGEAVGEIRRFLLDNMRQGDLTRGEELLGFMDDIYSVLVTLDFPDAITGGLRRTTDMVRGVLERTRSDLTLAVQQKLLESKLAHIEMGESSGDVRPVDFRQASFHLDGASTGSTEGPDLDSIEMETFTELSKWRDRKANEDNVASFIIARNSWLKEIVRLRPRTVRELYAVKGLGERWINKYGKEVVAIVNKGR